MREKRLLAVLVYGLPLLVLLAAALGGGYALARLVDDEFSAGVFRVAGTICVVLAVLDALALLALLGVRALREVE